MQVTRCACCAFVLEVVQGKNSANVMWYVLWQKNQYLGNNAYKLKQSAECSGTGCVLWCGIIRLKNDHNQLVSFDAALKEGKNITINLG